MTAIDFREVERSFALMKGTIATLVLVVLELTLCLVSPRWRLVDLNESQICVKNLLARFNTSSLNHRYLHVGPLFSSRIVRTDRAPEHFSSNHAKAETALLIGGIVLLVASAIALSSMEFCLDRSTYARCRLWLHLVNVILLAISLILLIVGFYLLQHLLKQPLNGGAAMGFFIGILFIVMLATHSGMEFWSGARDTFFEEAK